MKRILVGMPTWSGQIPIEVMFSLMSLTVPEGYQVNFGYVKRTPIDSARNALAEKMLNEGYDYILFCDDDTICNQDSLELMLSIDKPVVIPPIPARKNGGEGRLCLFDEVWSGQLAEVLEERRVGGGGMAFTLIKREALEAVAKKYGAPFALGEWDGKKYSEDTSFCRRAGEVGFEIWTMPSVTPAHIGDSTVYVYEGGGIESYVLG